MFFLMRMTFWFSLVLLMLPFGGGDDGQQVGPLKALMTVREAVGDIAGICERKPDVCETGKSAMYTISVRARETAKIAAAMLDEQQASGQQTDDKQAAGPDTSVATGSVAEVVLPATVEIPAQAPTKH